LIGSKRGIFTAAVEGSKRVGVVRRAVSLPSMDITKFSFLEIQLGIHPTDVAVPEDMVDRSPFVEEGILNET
jgi:hypothetical protein